MNRRTLTTALALAAGSVLLTACGGGAAPGGGSEQVAAAGATGRKINIGPDQHRIHGTKDPEAAALVPAGREPVDIKYFHKPSDTYLALQSGRLDGFFGPNPTAAYHVNTAGQTELVGTFSGGGDRVQGKIAATTKKGSGLVKAYAAALQKVIDNGRYGKVLARWGLTGEHLKTSQINPPGLPRAAN
ncbi:hypothetical protein ACWGJW_34780 [Streptomyces nigrescens]